MAYKLQTEFGQLLKCKFNTISFIYPNELIRTFIFKENKNIS